MDTTTTSPETGTVESAPMSFDQGVDAIAGLLNDDQDSDHVRAEVAKDNDPKQVPEGDNNVEELSEEDLLLQNVEHEDGEPAAPETPAAVSDDMEVSLDDGTKISIGQLKRNNLFQRDYSRKTEELARHKEQLDQQFSQRLSEAENELRQRRDLVLELASQFVPQEPDVAMMQNDPLGYIEQKAMYDARMKQLNELHAHREREMAAERQRGENETREFIVDQQQKLFSALPHLKDSAKREAFRQEVLDIGVNHYGVTPEEANSIADHRYMRILHDAIAYQKLKLKAASIQKEVAAKPKLVQQNRMAPQAAQIRDRQGRFDTLRKEGSIDAAAKAIEALL